MTRRRWELACSGFVALATTLLSAGCAGGESSTSNPSSSAQSSSRTVVLDNLVMPFEVVPPPELEGIPTRQEYDRVINWLDGELGIRGVIPISVVPGGGQATSQLPSDYAQYIRSIESLTISGETLLSIGDQSAEVFSIRPQPGSYNAGELGCGVELADGADAGVADATEGCFGFPDDLLYRMAVIRNGEETLLLWARVPGAEPDQEFFAHFDAMLKTLEFVET